MRINPFLLALLVLFTFLLLQPASAQKGRVEAGIDIGYGFSAGQGSIQSSTSTLTNLNETVVPYSLGAGLQIGANGTYFFSDNIGAGLTIHYISGNPASYEYQSN